MDSIQMLSTEYLKQLFEEINENINYIWNQKFEESSNIIDNLILQRKEIENELAMR